MAASNRHCIIFKRVARNGAFFSTLGLWPERDVASKVPAPMHLSPNGALFGTDGQVDYVAIDSCPSDGRLPIDVLEEWVAKHDPRLYTVPPIDISVAIKTATTTVATDNEEPMATTRPERRYDIFNSNTETKVRSNLTIDDVMTSVRCKEDRTEIEAIDGGERINTVHISGDDIYVQLTDDSADIVGTSLVSKAKRIASDSVATAKDEMADGAWRSAAKQSLKRTRNALVKALRAKRVPTPLLKWIEAFLATEEGLATYGILAGTALSFAPRVSARPRWKRLCHEMRVFGFAGWIDAFVDPLLDLLENAIEEALSDIPDDDDSFS